MNRSCSMDEKTVYIHSFGWKTVRGKHFGGTYTQKVILGARSGLYMACMVTRIKLDFFFLRVATFMLCSSVPSLQFVHFIFSSLPIIQIFVKPLSHSTRSRIHEKRKTAKVCAAPDSQQQHSAISKVLNCQLSVQREAVQCVPSVHMALLHSISCHLYCLPSF
jgi:hypothetical protein